MQDPFSLKGPLRIVSQVPLQSKAVAVQLGDEIPTSDNYRLVFSDTWSGQVSVNRSSRVQRSVMRGREGGDQPARSEPSNARAHLRSDGGAGADPTFWWGSQIFAQSDKFSVVAKGSGQFFSLVVPLPSICSCRVSEGVYSGEP